MKKLILFSFLSLILLALPAISKTLEGGVEFDWISKTQIQRDENIAQIQSILFGESTVKKYPKKEFREKYAEFRKDKNSRENYLTISNGKTEDEDKNYSAFFMKNGLLYMYGIQYKNNLKNFYYYDAMGNLHYIDFVSDNYPNFPYYSKQYNVNGELVGTVYFISSYDQYIFKPDGKFVGRWYKENMYNRNAKVIMKRTNY